MVPGGERADPDWATVVFAFFIFLTAVAESRGTLLLYLKRNVAVHKEWLSWVAPLLVIEVTLHIRRLHRQHHGSAIPV